MFTYRISVQGKEDRNIKNQKKKKGTEVKKKIKGIVTMALTAILAVSAFFTSRSGTSLAANGGISLFSDGEGHWISNVNSNRIYYGNGGGGTVSGYTQTFDVSRKRGGQITTYTGYCLEPGQLPGVASPALLPAHDLSKDRRVQGRMDWVYRIIAAAYTNNNGKDTSYMSDGSKVWAGVWNRFKGVEVNGGVGSDYNPQTQQEYMYGYCHAFLGRVFADHLMHTQAGGSWGVSGEMLATLDNVMPGRLDRWLADKHFVDLRTTDWKEVRPQDKGKIPEDYLGVKTGWELIKGAVFYFVDRGSNQDVGWLEKSPRSLEGYAQIEKLMKNDPECLEIIKGNPLYSLEGTKFGFYDKMDTAEKATAENPLTDKVLTVGPDGYTEKVKLKAKEWYVKELVNTLGFVKDVRVVAVNVKANKTNVFQFVNDFEFDPLDITIMKKDAETGKASQGGATTAGAEFTIKHYPAFYTREEVLNGKPAKDGVKPRVWIGKTHEVKGKDGSSFIFEEDPVAGDPVYIQKDEKVFPRGTLTVEETKAPEGYNLEDVHFKDQNGINHDDIFVFQCYGTGEKNIVSLELEAFNRVVRGDFSFTKRDEETKEEMADIPFKLTSDTTGESHKLMTDENGYYSSKSDFSLHTRDTNGGKKTSGLWFGVGSRPDDNVGALPYDTYTLEELSCEKNKGKMLYKGKVTISREAYTVDIGTIENPDVTVTTLAKAEDNNSHYGVLEKGFMAVDTLYYTGLKKKQTEIYSWLVDKVTGKEVVKKKKTVFTPKTAEGTKEIEFTFDSRELAGKALVVFEEIWQDGKLVAEHKDINDGDQTLYFPALETTALDKTTGGKLVNSRENVELLDKVSYKGLRPGKEYTLEGVLMDKATGRPLLLEGKQEVKSFVEFVPSERDGELEVVFVFDGRIAEGKELVVFEEIRYKKDLVVAHKDLKDEGQTVRLPKVQTEAFDSVNKGHVVVVDKDSKDVILKDKISYEMLYPGKYTVKSVLMDKATGKPFLRNGKVVTEEKEFDLKEAGGFEVGFVLDGKELVGKTLVVFEEIWQEGKLVAEHKDINDKKQTVSYRKPPKPPTVPRTGDKARVGVLLALLLGSLFGVLIYFLRNKRK